MSDDPSVAKPGSRQALMQQRRAAAQLQQRRLDLAAKQEEERKALEEQVAALQLGAPFDSTLERSLRGNLVIAHGEVIAAVAAADKDAADFLEKNTYGDEDLLDAEFWEAGVEAPPELDEELAEAVKKGGGLNKQQAKQLFAAYKAADAAYVAIDAAFCARALLAHELKLVFAKKREQLKEARAQAAQSSASAAVSEKKAEVAVSLAIKTSSKKCGCKSKCPPQCGCRKEGLGCSAACGCDLDLCQNPHSYADDAEGREKWAAALTVSGRRALKKKQGDAEEAKKAAMMAKIEAGQMDQQF